MNRLRVLTCCAAVLGALLATGCDDGTASIEPLSDTVLAVDTGSPDDASGDDTDDIELPDAIVADATDLDDAADTDDTRHDASDTLDDLGEDDVSDTLDASGDTTVAVDTTEPMPVDPCENQDSNPPDPGTRKGINDNPAFLQVYNNNVENLKTPNDQCRGDWTDLIYYMKTIKPSPDIFLVQQISNTAQLKTLTDRMTQELPGEFDGIIADADPWDQGSPCGPEKRQQTNAIVFRTGRFNRTGNKHVWQSWAFRNGECRRNGQARTRNVMVKLRDTVARKDVTVVSLHWSTAQGTGPDPACAEKNIRELEQKLSLADFEADLYVFGGDTNEPDRNSSNGFRDWYRFSNGDRNAAIMNSRDAVFYQCMGANSLHTCLDNNWTIGNGNRIDFLWSMTGEHCRTRMRRIKTITFDEADAAARQVTGSDSGLNYSDHRAIRAELYY